MSDWSGTRAALALARVVHEAALLGVEPGDPDRQLVAHQHRLVAAGRVARGGDRGAHAPGELGVRLAPATAGTGSRGSASTSGS